METSEYAKYIQKIMNEKGLNEETQQYVLKYIYVNQKLFGEFLDINKLINRILKNLNYNIMSANESNNLFIKVRGIFFSRGIWRPYDNKILINPVAKLLSTFLKGEKQKIDSTVMHEIDHCATTEYINMSEQEKEQYIQSYLEKKDIKNIKIIEKIKKHINYIYNKYGGKLAISGILDYRQVLKNGVNLRKINEGITAYKQEKYDRFFGNKTKTNYEIEKKVAEFIGNVIGEKELINMHFNNDYDGIREAFRERTGEDLNYIIKELNKKSKLKEFFFGKIYKMYFAKKIEKILGNYTVSNEKNTQSKKRSFREQLSEDAQPLEKQALNSKMFQANLGESRKKYYNYS